MKVFALELWHVIVDIENDDGELNENGIVAVEAILVDQLPSNGVHGRLFSIEQVDHIQVECATVVFREHDFEWQLVAVARARLDRIHRAERRVERIDGLRVAHVNVFRHEQPRNERYDKRKSRRRPDGLTCRCDCGHLNWR